MTEIIYDSYDGINADPDIVFGDLKFELKRFDFDKDIIFKNMTQIKKKKEDIAHIPNENKRAQIQCKVQKLQTSLAFFTNKFM